MPTPCFGEGRSVTGQPGYVQAPHGPEAELKVATVPLETKPAALPLVPPPCQAEPGEAALSSLFLGHEYADGAFCPK